MGKINICVVGKQGRMGQLAITAIRESSDLSYQVGVGRQDNLKQVLCAERPDVVIDVADAPTIYQRTDTVLAQNIPLVIGASGLIVAQREALQLAYPDARVLEVPNFSLGSIGMQYCAEFLARYMHEVSIIERHHIQKKDTPSGTASACQQRIAQQMGCAVGDIPIHSLRSVGVLAEQEITYAKDGESLRLIHQCINRSAYQSGLLLALRNVSSLQKWHIGLEKYLPSWPNTN
tara:strand:+ start:1809 stop:2507 length:699 start_codon:yes stop_codon:yes gene_type:complete